MTRPFAIPTSMPSEQRRYRKGRGAPSNPEGRFEALRTERVDDGWSGPEEEPARAETEVRPEAARTIISRNTSPDVPFDQSINPYRGCEHGCVYCYARPAHAYLNLSPGLDFETRLFYKADAARLLEEELRRPDYRCSMISLGANTDPYQPIERDLRVTRSLLEVLSRFEHPVGIVTKGAALIERDIDLLADMARRNLAAVYVSVTTLKNGIKQTLEPRAAGPQARLRVMRRLSDAGIPVGVMVAPVIPFITDGEMESILQAAREAGATSAGYVMLRLPHEVKDLFRDWLELHAPLKARHVMSLVQQMRGGKDYDARWTVRQRGEGEYARMIAQRFAVACRRLGYPTRRPALDTTRFRVPPVAGDQLNLFG